MVKSTTRIISSLALMSSLGLIGCAKSFNGSSATGSSSTDSQSSGSSSSSQSWEKVELNGYPSGGSYSKNLVIYIDRANQSLIFVLPVPVIIPIISEMRIPDLPDAKLMTYTDAGGGSNLAVSIPLRYIVKGAVFRPDQRLPSGDALPYVPAGELPGFAIDFPQMTNYRIHLYVGVNIAAVFAELPDLPSPIGGITAIFPVKDAKGLKQIGAVGYVGKKGTYKGGAYLAAQLPAELARVIDDLIRW